MHSSITIADEILAAAKEQQISVTPLQLVKLVYIAHGWWLAQTSAPLISDEVQAWKFGPVIPKLYHKIKKWGRNPIQGQVGYSLGSGHDKLPENVITFLSSVVAGYGKFNGIALSNLTHRPGTPWAAMYNDGELNRRIEDRQIRMHYERLLRERVA